jgi:hypothetical protein
MAMSGAMCAAVADYNSGMVLGSHGAAMDIDAAAAGATEVVKAQVRLMKDIGVQGTIEDILITLDSQFHIIRPSLSNQGLFIYFVLEREIANLALARRKVQDVDKALTI